MQQTQMLKTIKMTFRVYFPIQLIGLDPLSKNSPKFWFNLLAQPVGRDDDQAAKKARLPELGAS